MNFQILFLTLLPIAGAQLFGGMGGMGGGDHPISDMLVSRFISHLPESVQSQAQAIHQDKSMGPMQKMMAMRGLIQTLPEDQRPMAKFANRLPEPFRTRFNAIHNDQTLDFASKAKAIKSLLMSLPESAKAQLPGGGRLLDRLSQRGGTGGEGGFLSRMLQ